MTSSPSRNRAQKKRVTLADIAEHSGVSRATVSYVLNKVPGQTIPKATQQRVRAAAEELGYVPSAAAASLRRGYSRVVLVVTEPALQGYVTEPFLRAIAERMSEDGYAPLTYQYSTADGLRSVVSELRPFGVLALTSLDEALVNDLRHAGVRKIYASAQGDPDYRRPWEEEIGQMQVQHLVETGAERIVYASPERTNPRYVMARSRQRGAIEQSKGMGLVTPDLVELGPDRARADEILSEVLPRQGKTGICAFDDDVAAIALATARELGFSVPDQVAVIGVDDAPFSAFLAPPLTTLSVDGHSTGRIVGERFLGTPAPEDDGVSHAYATLITREST